LPSLTVGFRGLPAMSVKGERGARVTGGLEHRSWPRTKGLAWECIRMHERWK